MGRLQEIPVGGRGRIGLCRFMGPRTQNRRAQPVDSMLRRAPLRRSARRRIADSTATALPAKGYRRNEAAGLQRTALSDSAVWNSGRRARWTRSQLQRKKRLRSTAGATMDAVTLDRIHFAFTIIFHYLFPQLTMGL